MLRIATYLKRMPLLPIAGVVGPLVPGFLRDAVYDLVANNRDELLGMKDEFRLSDDRVGDRRERVQPFFHDCASAVFSCNIWRLKTLSWAFFREHFFLSRTSRT